MAAWGCWPWCRWPLAGVLPCWTRRSCTTTQQRARTAHRHSGCCLRSARRRAPSAGLAGDVRRAYACAGVSSTEGAGAGAQPLAGEKQCANLRSHDHRSAMCSPWERCPGDWEEGARQGLTRGGLAGETTAYAERTPPLSDERAMTAAVVQGRRPWHKHWNEELLRDGCALRG